MATNETQKLIDAIQVEEPFKTLLKTVTSFDELRNQAYKQGKLETKNGVGLFDALIDIPTMDNFIANL